MSLHFCSPDLLTVVSTGYHTSLSHRLAEASREACPRPP